MFSLFHSPLTAATRVIRELPLSQGLILRHTALELFVHELLSEMARRPELKRISMRVHSPEQKSGAVLELTYEGAELIDDGSMLDFSGAFPCEYFIRGEFVLDESHPAVAISRTGDGGLDAYYPAVSGLACEIAMHLQSP